MFSVHEPQVINSRASYFHVYTSAMFQNCPVLYAVYTVRKISKCKWLQSSDFSPCLLTLYSFAWGQVKRTDQPCNMYTSALKLKAAEEGSYRAVVPLPPPPPTHTHQYSLTLNPINRSMYRPSLALPQAPPIPIHILPPLHCINY